MQEHIRKILGIPVKTPIEYWDKYWYHFTDLLSRKDNHDASLDSPRFLIENIISEIEYNNFQNKENRELFRGQLGTWDKQDAAFNKLFHNKVVLLQQKWDESSSKYILSICKQIEADFSKGLYFNSLLENLIKVIRDRAFLDYNTKKEINKYTQLIISEFIASGFIIDDIKSIQRDIPDIIIAEGGRIVYAPDSYRGISKQDYNNEELYYSAVKESIDNRTVEERVYILKEFYFIEPKNCYALFRLEGIKGDIDYMIDDINIYSPHLKQYITEISTLSKIEQIDNLEVQYVNVAIPVKHKMLHSSVAYAKQKLEKIIDLLSLSYDTSIPIDYCQDNISIVEDGAYICGTNISFSDKIKSFEHSEFTKHIRSLDVAEIQKDLPKLHERFISINQKYNSKKIATAAHWFQKGKYSQNAEDKLLFHWIAIESIFKIDGRIRDNITGREKSSLLDTVKKIAASIIVKTFFYNYCYDSYIYLHYLTKNNDNYLDIPTDIIKKASLDVEYGTKIKIHEYFKYIQDIQDNMNDEILKIDLYEIDAFYRNDQGVKNKEQELFNEITLIYRLRNLIAHNAVYPQYLINIYASKAEYISSKIIRYLIDKLKVSNDSLEEILIETSSKYDEFMLNIDNEIERLKS